MFSPAIAQTNEYWRLIGTAFLHYGFLHLAVNMISLARSFDMHMKLLQNAESNDSKAGQLLSMN